MVAALVEIIPTTVQHEQIVAQAALVIGKIVKPRLSIEITKINNYEKKKY
jgi:hypothetical protein